MKNILASILIILLFSCQNNNSENNQIEETCESSENNYLTAKNNYETDQTSVNCVIYKNAINKYLINCNLTPGSFDSILNSLGNCNDEDN